MRSINLNRQLVGIEDLLIGFGTVMQTRGGQQTLVTKINAGSLPFDETQSLLHWAQTVNLAELGAIIDELTIVANNKDSIVAVSNNSVNINLVAGLNDEIASLYTNLIAIQSNYTNITTLIDIHNNMANLLLIASQIIPNITEILNVDVLATQVANDKAAVETMKLAVETIYDTFDDRFLGSKVNDPTVDNDGNALIDGAMYFNTSSNAIKVYDLGNTLWVTIPQIYLSGLLDVQLTSIATGDILTWNGTKWVNTRTPSFDSVKLNGGTSTQGTATWNTTDLTYDLVLNDNVTLQVGQEEVVYCKNNTLTTIPNGKPVMAVGTNGNSGNILVELHDGTKASAKRIIGLTTQPILPSNNINPYGFVTRNGKVRGLNTTGSDYGETWVDGDILYVKATGALTKVEPADTALKMPIAFVIHAHTNGTLYVRTTGIDENQDRDLIATKMSKVASTDNAIARFHGVTGDLQNSAITIDDNGNIGSGTQSFNGFGGSGVKNYLINGNFSVWQRGTSFTGLTNGTYSSDRWVVYDASGDINYNVIRNTGVFNSGYGATYSFNSGTATRSVIQFIENVTRFKVGSNVTISFEAYTNSTPYAVAVAIQGVKGAWASSTVAVTSNISLTNTKTKYSVTLPIPDWTSLGVDWAHLEDTKLALTFTLGVNTNGRDFILGSVQLEEGSVATPFENRPYGLELSFCQRYFYHFINPDALYRIIPATTLVTIPFLVSMRTAPTLTYSIEKDGIAQAVNSGVAVIQVSKEGVLFIVDQVDYSFVDVMYFTASAEL